MNGISSKALNFGDPENKKKKFQGQEYNDDLGVDMYEFKYRMDDPQIGRFWQVDPLSDKYVHNSTYAFSENKITTHVEIEGLESCLFMWKHLKEFQSTPEISQTGGGVYGTGSYYYTNRYHHTVVHVEIPDRVILDMRVKVNSRFPSSGLQTIQTVNGNPGVNLGGSPLQQMTLNGQNGTALVDGGINSPSGESIKGKPYYNSTADLADNLFAGATWNKNNNTGSITATDVPGGVHSFSEIKFETYFVLTNYSNTQKDKIVGKIEWGFTIDIHGTVTPIGKPQLVRTDHFSPSAAAIIKHDYPKYKIFQ